MNIRSLFTWFSRPKKADYVPLTEEQLAINRAFYRLEGQRIASAEYSAAHRTLIELNTTLLARLRAQTFPDSPEFHLEQPVDISLKLLLEEQTLSYVREHGAYLDFWLSPEDLASKFGPLAEALLFRGLQLTSITLREHRNGLEAPYLLFAATRRSAAA